MAFRRLAAWLCTALTLALLAAGCATHTGPTSYNDRTDAQAMHEMEWNLDPWR